MKRLLVTVDSLRLDHYQFMEHTQAYMGDSHPRAFSTATATMGAFPTMMTGRYDANHSIDPRDSFVNSIGDPSIGITTNRLTTADYGYDGGFDTFISPSTRGEDTLKDKAARQISNDTLYRIAATGWSLLQQVTPTTTSKSFRRTDDVVDQFLDWINGKEEWFGWLHLMEPHHPYDPDGTSLSRSKAQSISRNAIATNEASNPETIRELYKQEVIETDERLKRLWENLPEDTRTIFTADHGELLGEDGVWGHPGQMFHPDILRIPFAMRNISVDSDVVSFIDIPALLLGQDWQESKLQRTIAFASMSGMKCAFDENHILSDDDYYAIESTDSDPSPHLQRELESFTPSQITKQDGIKEDLRALGYLDE